MEPRLSQEIIKVLVDFPKYWETDKLQKQRIVDDLREYDSDLLAAFMMNELIANTFTININGNKIFKMDEFIEILRFKNFWGNSYTKYSNEIGLTSEGKYLHYNTDVVLDFPYKDSVLEGGMTIEDSKRNEIYYHKILAKEEIDVLFSPKVLCNAVRYSKDKEEVNIQFKDTDNLVLKGNNLIALHTLKERFAGKVKLIYIDPPYNTGNDSFGYNDRFNHSTWLTFMKNRLEVAKELLSDDGSIWINIDDDESHYLKVLADGIFNRDNFIANIIWQKKYSPQNDAKYFSDMHDHILVYAKSKTQWVPNPMPRTATMDSRYTNRDNDPRGPWKAADFSVRTYSKDYDYVITTPSGRKVSPPKGRVWGTSEDNFRKLVEDNRVWFGKDGNNVPSIKKFLSEVKSGSTPTTAWIADELYNEDELEDFWSYVDVSHTQDSKKEMLKLDLDFATPKPEKLLERIINIGSNEGDLILDFFMGSATSQAVAMKLNRKFIGIEQMNYIKEISVTRLKKVIDGEQGGISKSVGWKGGGSFVYTELLTLNELFIQKVQGIQSDLDLIKVFNEMKDCAFLNYKVNLEKLPNINNVDISLDEKKKILINSLDINQLYLSYFDIEDETYSVSKQDKVFSNSFYRGELKDE